MSRMIAENENKRVNIGLANRGVMQQKLDADLTVSNILINSSKALDQSLGTLIQTVQGVVTSIDAVNNATRGGFVDSMKAVNDPRTGMFERGYQYTRMAVITLLNTKVGM